MPSPASVVPAPALAQPTVDVAALAAAATQSAIPEDIAYAATAPARAAPSRRDSTAGPAPSSNKTFLIILVVMVLAAGGVGVAIMLS
jgi:hypothetical protein